MKKELAEALAQKIAEILKDKYDLASVILMTNSNKKPRSSTWESRITPSCGQSSVVSVCGRLWWLLWSWWVW